MTSELDKISQEKSQNIQSDNEEIYFIISYISEENININFRDLKCLSEIYPKIIYENNIEKEKGSFLFYQVFKLTVKEKENSIKYEIQYEKGEQIYIISFDIKHNKFIFEIKLQKYNKYLYNIPKQDIDQNQINIRNKLDIFFEALENNNEMNKVELLYTEAIELYKTQKNFSLLIFLFLKLYKKYKELCSRLIDIFKEINYKENTDKDKDLDKYLNSFKEIFLNANNIIKENKYNPISFYGIILCYLSSYDTENLSKILNEFSEEDIRILYEILIIYYSHFNISLNQTSEFYNNFVKYIINKEDNYKSFERMLNYIDDIETFLYVINENKNKIFKEYGYELRINPITSSSNFKVTKKEYSDNKYKKTELDNIISIIKELIKFSKEHLILTIYLKSSFWIYLLKQYNNPHFEYIDNCYRLRELFKNYKDLINFLYTNNSNKNELKIKDDINRYNNRDEFAFILNTNIKQLILIKKDEYSDQEKLAIILKYNPYFNNYNEEDIIKYQNLRDTDIFDNINFKNPSEEFKLTFHSLNFEERFKKNIKEFINKITSKIIDISTFGTIVELIDVTRLDEETKIYYYKILKEKYTYIIRYEIDLLKEGEDLNKAIDILCKFICLIFEGENITNFLDEQITKLDDKLQKLIYFELLRRYKEEKYEKIKTYIFELYLKKLKEPDKIIELIK